MIVRHLLVLLLSTPVAAYRLQPGRHVVSSPGAARSRAVTASADADTNADAIAALKRSFYGAADKEEVREEADDPPVGLLRDMPLCRWPWEVLPHHQRVIVVHEPQARYYLGTLRLPHHRTTLPPCSPYHTQCRSTSSCSRSCSPSRGRMSTCTSCCIAVTTTRTSTLALAPTLSLTLTLSLTR